MAAQHDTAQLLTLAQAGNREAFDRLFANVYDELRQIAHQRLFRHRPGETLNTTALVHEAYLRLVARSSVDWQDRAHFLALASRAMRFVLVDYARSRTAQKRGGAAADVPLEAVQVTVEERAAEHGAFELLLLHEALEQLETLNERLARLVEYRFFGGLTYEEVAEVTGCSVATVKRDWTRARTWLYRFMQGAG